jgi:Protein of unknown function (DUF2795)
MAGMEVWTYRRAPTGIDLKEFDVEAVDGSIGTIDQATDEAGVSYIVVDTGRWIFGKKVLLPAGVVDRIDTAEEKVYVNRTRDEIKNAPEFDLEVGATDRYRQDVGSYYTARPTAATGGRRRSVPGRQEARQTTSQRSTSRSARSRSRGRGQAGIAAEPTKDELYEQAKRLEIEGRSKMNKAQLKRAVERQSGSSQSGRGTSGGRGRGKANPVEVQTFLEGVSYPTRKGDLLREAERQGASKNVRSTLERLPDQRYEDPTDVSKSVSKAR